MKLTKILLTGLVTLLFSTSVNADGPLKMKGFHHDMSFEEGCELVKTLKHRSDTKFLPEKDGNGECGYALLNAKSNKFVFQGVFVYKNDKGGIKGIYLPRNSVNSLFNAENLNLKEFLQAFVNGYSWIDGFEIKRRYNAYTEEYIIDEAISRSPENGWEIRISHFRNMEIRFFEPSRPSFTEGTTLPPASFMDTKEGTACVSKDIALHDKVFGENYYLTPEDNKPAVTSKSGLKDLLLEVYELEDECPSIVNNYELPEGTFGLTLLKVEIKKKLKSL